MLKSLVATLGAFLCGFDPGVLAAASYTIEKWPDDIGKLPCDEWTRTEDGSWKQTGTVFIANGGRAVSGKTFSSGVEFGIIDKRCGQF